jgi:hypothetical protein
MDDRPTCGKGLAEHSALPAQLSRLTAAVADVLENHMMALDLRDERSRQEHDAYRELVKGHRTVADQLRATAHRMAGYRDLPMGRHDPVAMADPQSRAVFERVVKLEEELLHFLETRLDRDRATLVAMTQSTSRATKPVDAPPPDGD